MFWGLTPALDLLDMYKTQETPLDLAEINILIVGGADCRHVLKTIARKYRHTKIKLNFYLMDGCVEIIAKQLLLFNVAFQLPEQLGDIQKTRIFMELYGNAVIRPYVAKYLCYMAGELIKMITDYKYLKQIMHYMNLDIKYKDRDYLENLFKFWCSSDDFDICHSWDRRVRKMLGTRYDSKLGAFDWDLHMRFHLMGGSQVCPQEYKSFRNSGVPFIWLESEVSKPNRSLVCAIIPNGEKFVHYGYLGDIQTGPFVTYGIECEDQSFLQSTNGQNKFRSTDVTERNLRQMFHEIFHQEKYSHQTTSDYLLGSVQLQEDKMVVDISAENKIHKMKSPKFLNLQEVNIKFMSISSLNQMSYREEYKEFFNVIYFGSTYLKYLEKELIENLAAKKTLLIVENQRFVLSYRDKELKEFENNLKEKIKEINNLAEIPFDVFKDNYAQFICNV